MDVKPNEMRRAELGPGCGVGGSEGDVPAAEEVRSRGRWARCALCALGGRGMGRSWGFDVVCTRLSQDCVRVRWGHEGIEGRVRVEYESLEFVDVGRPGVVAFSAEDGQRFVFGGACRDICID